MPALTDQESALVRANSSPVFFVLKRYRRALRCSYKRRVPPDDLMQAGFMGLLHAARHYQPAKGEFGVYAYKCVLCTMKSEVGQFFKDPVAHAWPLWREDKVDPRTLKASRLEPDVSALLEAGVTGLRSRLVTVVRLRMEGLLLREIGARLGICKQRSRDLLASALSQLKENLPPPHEIY